MALRAFGYGCTSALLAELLAQDGDAPWQTGLLRTVASAGSVFTSQTLSLFADIGGTTTDVAIERGTRFLHVAESLRDCVEIAEEMAAKAAAEFHQLIRGPRSRTMPAKARMRSFSASLRHTSAYGKAVMSRTGKYTMSGRGQ